MGRMDERAITICIVHLAGVEENTAETELSSLNARICETFGVKTGDFTRSVDSALTLIPEGWSAEITWQDTQKRSSVVLSAPNSNTPESVHRLVSHSLRHVVKVHYPLSLSICLAALKVHLLNRKRAKPRPNVST